MTDNIAIVLQPPLDALFDTPPSCIAGPATTLLEALGRLCGASKRAQAHILLDGGLSPYVHVFLNGAAVEAGRVAEQPVMPGDEICLLTAIRGG